MNYKIFLNVFLFITASILLNAQNHSIHKKWKLDGADERIKTNRQGDLVLEFSEKPFALKKWIITDIIGDKTTVLIQNAKYNNDLPFTLFFPDTFPEPNN